MTYTATLVHITPHAENLVAYMARVSNPANQDNQETAPKLIRYLIKHKHWSPLEMVSMCVEINTTRSIAAQILRHRSFSFQEYSQRYALVIDEPQVPALRRQDTKNRQNSIDDLDKEVELDYRVTINDHFQKSVALYLDLVEAGVAKECAREVLPLATPTRIYMHGTLRSWIHYCQLRCANGTQKEHQDIALAIKDILAEQVPDIYEAAFCE